MSILLNTLCAALNGWQGWGVPRCESLFFFAKTALIVVVGAYMGLPAAAQPAGFLEADGFDYPVGSRGYNGTNKEPILENGSEERNTLFPNSTLAQPPVLRLGEARGWFNYQDVGSYYSASKAGGIHPGEDWNNATKDLGENIYAVANGQVIKLDVVRVYVNGVLTNDPTYAGWYVVIRHWIRGTGQIYDSVYLHVSPLAGGALKGTRASDFPFGVNAAVSKGDIIGRIGSVSSFGPHLHFEMRDKPIGNSLWPNDNGNGYYANGVDTNGMSLSEVTSAFDKMRLDGIIDPSDFIDDHRTLFSASDLLSLKTTHPNRIEVRNCIALGIMNNKDGNGVVDDRVWMNLERTLSRGEVVTILKAAANAYKVNLVESLPTVNPGNWFAGDTDLSSSSHYPTVQLFAQKGLLDITQPKFRVNDPASFGEAVHFLWKVFGLGDGGPAGSESLFTYRRDKLKTALFLRPLELDYDLSSPTSLYYQRLGGVLTRKITARRDWLYEKGIGELKDMAYSNPIRRSVIAKLMINTILWRITNPSPAVP
ncbi:MAG: M23 family metallopeptidase [Prosthecobacter sp.]|jgi:murein DD-endopeptidase MepM/ murein hydrolase activator NlpD|uniref:M23 family metallopeptidase n=1 Tax=Prosthecobacter sp. TaxID=1965333 RepID=UPI0019E6E81C|nr:M23 family metallopeptidase [Prosthecobacter sp.]MBE2282346.1 M23 family metallopeptidase [Prosthecobacter sp.]